MRKGLQIREVSKDRSEEKIIETKKKNIFFKTKFEFNRREPSLHSPVDFLFEKLSSTFSPHTQNMEKH